MEMTRRGFLKSILIAGVAPAIVRAESLMVGVGLIVPSHELILPQQGIVVPVMAKAARIFTVRDASGAHQEALLEGLIPLRRYMDSRGVALIDFDLPRTTPRYTGGVSGA